MPISTRLMVASAIAAFAMAATLAVLVDWHGCQYIVEGGGIDGPPRRMVQVCQVQAGDVGLALVVFVIAATSLFWLLRRVGSAKER